MFTDESLIFWIAAPGDSVGCSDKSKAAWPATTGAAKEVPLQVANVLPGKALYRSTPGAETDT